ncbi:hypothetical protein EP7_005665 (plasmid) [Isosphaeraceae bacterium EP7]
MDDRRVLRGTARIAGRAHKVFAAVKHGNAARLSYAEFCAHAPHIGSGYISADIEFNPTQGREDLPEWTMSYVPGPRARSEHRSGDRRAVAPSPEPAVDGLVVE